MSGVSWRTARAVGSWAVLLVFVAAWAMFLRPPFLGGQASFIGVQGVSMTPTMPDGAMALAQEESSYRAGDVIAYRIPEGRPGAGNRIVHRIVGGDGDTGFVTRGDHNTWDDVWRPRTGDVVGRVVGHVPGVAGAFAALGRPAVFAAVAGGLTFLAVVWPRKRRADEAVDEPVLSPSSAPSAGRAAVTALVGLVTLGLAVNVGLARSGGKDAR